jgi:site-specific recombinase XerD
VRTALRIFIEADGQGNFTRRIHAPAKPTVEIFTEWVVPYLRFLREHRGLSEGTLRLNVYALHEFTEFVDKRGIRNLYGLNAHHIHDFCSDRGSRKPATWLWYMSNVRCFLNYVFSHGGLQHDLSLAVGGAKHFRYARVPDVLTESDFDKLLSRMDRSSPVGRRDSAIILLAAGYGMRPSDIRELRLDDIHWRGNYIAFRQSKTGKNVILPLLAEISEALIDYLRAGRPSTLVRNIFVRHEPPIEPYSSRFSFYNIMRRALHRAGLDRRRGLRGLYLLRHTLATRMLRAQIPMKTIGDVLGHATMNSTFVYTKVDVSALCSASLSIAEVLS